jgi:hypothetical protein
MLWHGRKWNKAVSDEDSIADAMLQCARASRPTPFIWFQGVTHSQSSHSLYWLVCYLIFFSNIYLYVCVRHFTCPSYDRNFKKCCVDIMSDFTFMWPCIVTNFFIIKPTRCTNFTNLFCHETLHVSVSVQWINSWWWTDELSETCRVSWQNKFVKLVHLVGFITKKLCRSSCVFFLQPRTVSNMSAIRCVEIILCDLARFGLCWGKAVSPPPPLLA